MGANVRRSLQCAVGYAVVIVAMAGCAIPVVTNEPSDGIPTTAEVSTIPSATALLAPSPDTSRTSRPPNLAKPSDRDDSRTFEELLDSAYKHRSQRDLAGALTELALAEEMIQDRSPSNEEYIDLLLMKADTYAMFERLDEAEEALLKATFIPDEHIDLIADSTKPLSEDEFLEIADSIHQLASQTDLPGYHVALSLIYNILGDRESLAREQQAAMDVSVDKDVTLAIAMGLYKVRGRKLEVHAALAEQILRSANATEDWVGQYQLAAQYYFAGWFSESQEIVDRYLALLDPADDEEPYLNFLALKMNIEMGLGHYEAMKEYEAKILAIDPNAFDEFSQ